MISMIWISQTALRFADTDLFATILFSLVLTWIVLSFKGDEEGGVTGLFQYLIAGFLYFCTTSRIWNKNTLPQDDKTALKPKKGNKKSKENPPPVSENNTKRKQKKGKRSSKKNFCKENTEPATTKKEPKMFTSWDICGKLKMDQKSIYEQLYRHILTDTQLKMNHFPREGYQPWTQVAVDDTKRQCARCGQAFDIHNGLHLSPSTCHYHPRKATFLPGTRTKVHGCCDLPSGSPPCATCNNHVTVQHTPRALTRTSSRRHVRKGRQYGIYSLDCEMCYTTDGLEVVRVGLVNMDGHAVYDGYVKPKSKILDYNTLYSGVDRSHLRDVTVTLDDVKQILAGYIQEDTILVGHALNNDLSALGLVHNTVVDTSVLYADPYNPSKKRALKTLASSYLGLTIQDAASGHDCIDDARASLQLALLKVERAGPSHQHPHHRAANQSSEVTQSEPLVEIQNFDGRSRQKGLYDYCQRPLQYQSPLLYNPSLGYYTPYLRGGV